MFRYGGAIWVAIVATAILAAPVVSAESIVGLVEQTRPAVVTVITYGANGKENGQASGFFVTSDRIVTNWHVVKAAKSLKARTVDGTVYVVDKVHARDEAADLAVLRLRTPNLSVRPLKITPIRPKQGERVVVIGCAGGLEMSVSDGIVSATREIPEIGTVIQITAPVSKGSSGSPVVNMRGEVVGVVVGYYDRGQNLNFAVPGERILALKPGGSRVPSSTAARAASGPSAKSRMKAGLALMEQKNYAGARRAFSSAVEADPTNYMAWGFLGACYLINRDYDKALSAFYKAVNINPRFVEGYSGLAVSLVGLGKPDTAMKAYRTAIKLDPKNAFAHYGLGMLHVMLKDRKSALEEYSILLTLDRDKAAELFGAIYGK